MNKIKEAEFNLLCEDILKNEKFQKLKEDLHHGITRYEHALRVAKSTFKTARFLHMKNIGITTRAALLHDFYTNEDFKNNENEVQKLSAHPLLAYNNAKKYFELNEIQENIIKSHMFPIKGEKPKYKESWLVTLMDKKVATYEMICFKFPLAIKRLFTGNKKKR